MLGPFKSLKAEDTTPLNLVNDALNVNCVNVSIV